jgi:tRNA(fMet)-specific endonuclease VapC
MNYMLDTNACLDFLLARSELVAMRVKRDAALLCVSAITAAELRVGNRTSADPEQDARNVDMFLSAITVHSFDGPAAEAYGGLVRQMGLERSSFDRLIGAHAVSLGVTLVTRNQKDFADVPGLKIENWAK